MYCLCRLRGQEHSSVESTDKAGGGEMGGPHRAAHIIEMGTQAHATRLRRGKPCHVDSKPAAFGVSWDSGIGTLPAWNHVSCAVVSRAVSVPCCLIRKQTC